jgi:hypothetical protein
MEPLNNESPGTPGQILASSTTPPLGFEDRSTGLLIFGVFEIIGGVLAALEVPAAWFFLLSPKFPRPPGSEMSLRSVVLNCASWAVAAGVLITLGLGAMRARRWAWALNLILSWLGLVAGTIIVGSMWIATKPGGMGRFMLGPALLMPGITGLFLLFYRSNDVEQTCKHRDPVERWTDRQPLPVLAAVLLAAWGAACGLAWNHTPHVAAFFGRYSHWSARQCAPAPLVGRRRLCGVRTVQDETLGMVGRGRSGECPDPIDDSDHQADRPSRCHDHGGVAEREDRSHAAGGHYRHLDQHRLRHRASPVPALAGTLLPARETRTFRGDLPGYGAGHRF